MTMKVYDTDGNKWLADLPICAFHTLTEDDEGTRVIWITLYRTWIHNNQIIRDKENVQTILQFSNKDKNAMKKCKATRL